MTDIEDIHNYVDNRIDKFSSHDDVPTTLSVRLNELRRIKRKIEEITEDSGLVCPKCGNTMVSYNCNCDGVLLVCHDCQTVTTDISEIYD